jgi:hypothetical protein
MQEKFKVKLTITLQVSLKDAYFKLQLFLYIHPNLPINNLNENFPYLYEQLQYYRNLCTYLQNTESTEWWC